MFRGKCDKRTRYTGTKTESKIRSKRKSRVRFVKPCAPGGESPPKSDGKAVRVQSENE